MTATIPESNSAEGNRPPRVDIPNGMHTAYTYDTSGRQDSIHHKDGTTIVQGFDYTFDNCGNITRIDHEDGAYWACDYDGRDRLIEAERYDATPALLHRYTYTYDDGDNMLTKAVYDAATTNTATTTYTYNDANEQLTMSDGSTTTTMTYDAWGRLTGKDDGTYTATYAYRYGSKLYSVASNFPSEGNVTYETGGDGKRRSRVAGLDEAWYNYTVGFDMVSTENDADGSTGALTMTNVVIAPAAQISATLGDLAGTTPASGTARYYATDHLGSTRSVWDASKTTVGAYEFSPYGSEYNHTGAALTSLASAYTGKPWDDTTKLFHFPYRQYSPDMARWTTRDPLGMVDGPNVYAFVTNSPVTGFDQLGLVTAECAVATAAAAAAVAVAAVVCLGSGPLAVFGCYAANLSALAAFANALLACNPCPSGSPPPPPPQSCGRGYSRTNWQGMCICVKRDPRVKGPYSKPCPS